ncbi:MAG: hypothetical protein ACRDS9_05720 [Pseudonocardiaceae bacterium]
MTEASFQGPHARGERGRVTVPGRCTDWSGDATLLAIQESEGTWVIYPPIGACGVRLSAKDTVSLAEAILAHAR